ncbi:DALR anticodon-binding domain-containing protein [Streptomyces sp. APSN-46.1]|uniref:ArgS-related anticodon-binding protein NrtL n=1 Tax=Streptomyces sp. APSN-46.1 TaxID=2929049 RepID=UPI001FB4D8DF|nr:DALR anticodon-binding domain-containing protein [Streptomyces sp. APSN-46.1]MCJ1680781.1 DALR anticodon-binding domain-containing protein [Streptomyces sp. APSN-46.1]
MTPADLSRSVVRAVRCAVEDGELPAEAAVPERVVVDRTRPGGVGDYATPVAFQVAKTVRRAPADVAAVLARRLGAEPGIEHVEVTGAGFLNFVLPPPSAPSLVREAIVWDIVIRDVRGGAIHIDADAGTGLGLRERVVRQSVLRLVRAQGGSERDLPDALPVAPLAKRDSDVVARYGAHAARWGMLAVPARETPVFSDVLLVQGEASEFFRVRYAHARSRALLRNADQLGFGPAAGDVSDAPELLRALADHPLVLEAAAHHRAPERLVRHLVELADALLDFQYRVLPQGDEKPSAAHRCRLALAEAAGTVLAGGLALLGIDAPDCL